MIKAGVLFDFGAKKKETILFESSANQTEEYNQEIDMEEMTRLREEIKKMTEEK